MKLFGLIGYPLTHSFSKGYFTQKFEQNGWDDCRYETFPIANIEAFTDLCAAHPNLQGLNVTIPYKEAVIPYLDGLSEEAAKIGAVNTIKFVDGKRMGYNSDVVGFEQSLRPLLKEYHKKALVLGTGGAAKAVWFVLDKLDIQYRNVSRTTSDNAVSYEEIKPEWMDEYLLIINTTPLGMYPKVEDYPQLPYESIGGRHLLFDLVYNPEKTAFLLKGEANGAAIKNGLDMLHGQAERSWEIWNEGK